MNREDCLVGIDHPLAQGLDQCTELMRDVVAHGVRDVDRARTRIDRRLQDPAQEVDLRAPRVFRRELHVVRIAQRPTHRRDRLLQDLVGGHVELLLHMDRRGRDEGVDAPGVGPGQRLPSAVDVLVERPGQCADPAVLNDRRDCLDALEVALAGDRESGLDHVHLELLECLGDAHLLVPGHGRAGRLLAVAQRGVEDDQMVSVAHEAVSGDGGAGAGPLGAQAPDVGTMFAALAPPVTGLDGVKPRFGTAAALPPLVGDRHAESERDREYPRWPCCSDEGLVQVAPAGMDRNHWATAHAIEVGDRHET
jgi:hypothetical protein